VLAMEAEREQAKQELELTEQQYRHLVENAKVHQGIWERPINSY